MKHILLLAAILYLSGTVPEKGYTIKDGIIVASKGYILVINNVRTYSAKFLPNTDYVVVVEAL